MISTHIPKIKICCISNLEEAKLAIRLGADALGLVSSMPSGPGVIQDSLIHQIASKIPPPIATFLLSSRTDTEEIIHHQKETGTNTLQLVDRLARGSYEEIRRALPGIRIVQVIHVADESALIEAEEVARQVDALLLDSGNPNLAVKELGGTGRVHNWDISARIRATVQIPIYLAGGLSIDNIQQAIEKVRPFGIDVCSGVRSHGELDREKLRRFIHLTKTVSFSPH